MADNPVKWSALGTVVHALTGVATTGLRNMAAAALILGAEIDNSAGSQYALFDFKVKGADTFHAGDYFSFWFIKAPDGTNYEDGAVAPARPADVVIPVRLVNTQQRIAVGPVGLPPGKFKVLAQNNTNHLTTDVDNETLLDLYMVNDNLVTA